MTALDDLNEIAKLDSQDVLGAVERFADQVREGWEIGRGAKGLPEGDGLDSIVVLGMGGSGVSGDVVQSVLELLCKAGRPLSEVRKPFERYAASGEINTTVDDPKAVIERVRAHFSAQGAALDEMDGLTVDLGDWWFNLRPSNTEPLLRLNLEAPDAASSAAHVAEVQELMKGTA